jgi:hypothetical protein
MRLASWLTGLCSLSVPLVVSIGAAIPGHEVAGRNGWRWRWWRRWWRINRVNGIGIRIRIRIRLRCLVVGQRSERAVGLKWRVHRHRRMRWRNMQSRWSVGDDPGFGFGSGFGFGFGLARCDHDHDGERRRRRRRRCGLSASQQSSMHPHTALCTSALVSAQGEERIAAAGHVRHVGVLQSWTWETIK